jgi:hypothetical protein
LVIRRGTNLDARKEENMEIITLYKILGIIALISLLLSVFIKKNDNAHAFFSMFFKVLAVGFYFMTFFMKGNKIALTINYALLLVTIILFIITTFLRKYISKKQKGIIGISFLLLVIALVINGFFI